MTYRASIFATCLFCALAASCGGSKSGTPSGVGGDPSGGTGATQGEGTGGSTSGGGGSDGSGSQGGNTGPESHPNAEPFIRDAAAEYLAVQGGWLFAANGDGSFDRFSTADGQVTRLREAKCADDQPCRSAAAQPVPTADQVFGLIPADNTAIPGEGNVLAMAADSGEQLLEARVQVDGAFGAGMTEGFAVFFADCRDFIAVQADTLAVTRYQPLGPPSVTTPGAGVATEEGIYCARSNSSTGGSSIHLVDAGSESESVILETGLSIRQMALASTSPPRIVVAAVTADGHSFYEIDLSDKTEALLFTLDAPAVADLEVSGSSVFAVAPTTTGLLHRYSPEEGVVELIGKDEGFISLGHLAVGPDFAYFPYAGEIWRVSME